MGQVVGRVGFERGIDLLLLSGTVAYAVLAIVPGYSQLIVGAILCGIAPALANPATNVGLSRLPGKRGVLMGIKQSGVQGAAVLAALVMAPLALTWGWRCALGACSALALIVWIAFAGTRPKSAPTPSLQLTDPAAGGGIQVRRMYFYAFFMGIGTANVTAYLALYGAERLSMTNQTAASLVAIVGVCGVLGRIIWGIVADRMEENDRSGYVLLTMVAGLAMASTVMIAASEHFRTAIWVGTGLIGLTGAAWNGLLMLIIVNRTGPLRLPTVSGRVQSAFFFGLCSGPPAFGLLVDRTGNYSWSWLGVAAAFGIALLSMLRPSRGWRQRSSTVGR
jgi:predicted MFS family arabinose efflux permease